MDKNTFWSAKLVEFIVLFMAYVSCNLKLSKHYSCIINNKFSPLRLGTNNFKLESKIVQ